LPPGFGRATKQATSTDGTITRRSIDGEADPFGAAKDRAEAEWKQALLQFWREQRERIKRKLAPGIPKSRKALEDLAKRLDKGFWSAEDRELLAVLLPLLSEEATGAADAFEDEIEEAYSLGLDWTLVNTEAVKWARSYGFDLVKGLNRTTAKRLQQSVGKFVETPGMTMGDLFGELEGLPAFNQRRAQLVATTEVTRAYAEGSLVSARIYEQQGWFRWNKIWRTSQDGLVCPVCLPLNDVVVEGVDAEFDSKAGSLNIPPSHPGCRCFTVLVPVIEEAEAEEGEAGQFPTGEDTTSEKVGAWLVEGTGLEHWQDAAMTERVQAKREIIEEIESRSGVNKWDADTMIRQWSHTNYGDDMRHLAIQEDAAEIFDLPMSARQQAQLDKLRQEMRDWKPDPVWGETEPPEKLLPLLDSKMQKSALRAMYDYTQEELANAGVGETIRLRRGVRLPFSQVEKWEVGDQVQVGGNVLESWSVGRGTARRFARDPELDEVGIVLEMDVPRSMILSTARTGFGCLKEGEFVVMGSRPGSASRIVAVYGE
jgi:hypothetical protein